MKSLRLLFLIALFALPACDSASPTTPTSPSLGLPFSATDLVVGAGTEAVAGKTVRVYYTGWLYSPTATDNKGTEFDAQTGGLGLTFVLGTGAVIAGWDQGVVGMKVGGKRRLVIPPELAYGEGGTGPIPGNATLLFEVELLSVAG